MRAGRLAQQLRELVQQRLEELAGFEGRVPWLNLRLTHVSSAAPAWRRCAVPGRMPPPRPPCNCPPTRRSTLPPPLPPAWQAPLPLMAPSMAARLAVAGGGSSGGGIAFPVALLGVVGGVSSAGQRVASRHMVCAYCAAAVDVLPGARSMPCCNADLAAAREDVSQRWVGFGATWA
jgi:hypothetical protein